MYVGWLYLYHTVKTTSRNYKMILQECYRVQQDDSANHDDFANHYDSANHDDSANHADNSLDLYYAKLSTLI